MPRTVLSGCVLLALALAGCSAAGEPVARASAGAVASGTTSATPGAPAETPSTSPGPSPEEIPEDDTFTMPALVGRTLQAAQDELQSRGSFLLDQRDAIGDRVQVFDRDWQVCSQRPRAGRIVATSTVVVLESVKLSEKCPG